MGAVRQMNSIVGAECAQVFPGGAVEGFEQAVKCFVFSLIIGGRVAGDLQLSLTR